VADPGRIRLEIGFEGAQVLSVYVSAEAADGLDGALAGDAPGGFTFEAEDGHYTVALDKIVFVKRFARESRVGFGAA
jgi:hypothetical protein